MPRALPVTRKCSFPFCDDDTSPLPLPLSHGELTQLSLNQRAPSLQTLSTFIHTPTPRRYSKYSSPHLRTKTSCILNTHILSPTTVDPCSHPGPGRLTLYPPPVQRPPSGSDSGLGWRSVSHPENHPLFPLTQPPPPLNTHRHIVRGRHNSAHTPLTTSPAEFPLSSSLTTAPPRARQSRRRAHTCSPGASCWLAVHSHLHSRFGTGIALPDSRCPY